MGARKTLQVAISDLAALYEYGELMVASMPIRFLGHVAAEVKSLRAVALAATAYMHACHDLPGTRLLEAEHALVRAIDSLRKVREDWAHEAG